MIDDEEINIAARAQVLSKHINEVAYFQLRSIEDFKDGAKWAINEFLKNLLHPDSEVPRNDNGKVLALSNNSTKLYNMNELMDKTNCTTYNEMWEQEVKKYHLKCWLFVKDFIESIMKGGNHD